MSAQNSSDVAPPLRRRAGAAWLATALALAAAAPLTLGAQAVHAQGEVPEDEEEPLGELGEPDASDDYEESGEEESSEEEVIVPRAVDPATAQERAAGARRDELEKSAYAFCHDDDYKPGGPYGDKRFCKTWDATALEVCPQARAMCSERPTEVPWHLELPSWLGWLLIGGLVLFVLFFFGRAVVGHDWRSDTDLDLGDVVDDAIAGELQALPEAPSQLILRKAAEALAAARVEEAAVLVQLACLRYFDDTGLAPFHPSRTNGEYLRALRRRSGEHHELYRRVALETDRVRFGSGHAERDTVHSCLESARQLLTRPPPPPEPFAASATLLLVAVLSVGLQPGCGDNDKPFYSHRPSGMSALPAMLRALGLEVEVGRRALSDIRDDVAVVVMESSAPRDLDKLALDDLLDLGVNVLILDDAHQAHKFLPVVTSSGAPVMKLPGFGGTLSLGQESPPPETVYVHDDWACGIDLSVVDARLQQRVQLPHGARLRTKSETETGTSAVSIHGWSIVPVLLVEHSRTEMRARSYAGYRVDKELGYFRAGCLMVFAEGDLFTNASLALPQNAQFVAAVFAGLTPEKHKVLLLDGLREGAADEGIARSVADSRMLPFILQGLLWVATLFVFLGAAFGPLRDPVQVQHKAFVEHVEALGRQYARLGDAGLSHIARALGKYLVMRHRGEVRGGSSSGWTTVAQHLAEKHELPVEDVNTALRLGLDGVAELGPPVSNEIARSEPVLRALSVLLTGRKRSPALKKDRRRSFWI